MAAIFQADIWCDDCADSIRHRIRQEGNAPDDCYDERNYDSDEYPKGCSDDEESDCPQHCAAGADCINAEVLSDGTKVGYFFGNSLTSYGDDYVREAVNDDRRDGDTGSVACELWAPCYDYIDYGPEDYCTVCGDYAELDCNDECENCAEVCESCGGSGVAETELYDGLVDCPACKESDDG